MITVIAAIGKNRELGKENDLIWHLPNDLKRFKRINVSYPIAPSLVNHFACYIVTSNTSLI